MFKQKIREQLVKRQEIKYQKKLHQMHFYYEDYIAAFEAKNPHFAAKGRVSRIYYDTLTVENAEEGFASKLDEQLLGAADEDIFLFMRRGGKLFKYAESYILQAFAEHSSWNLLYADEDELEDGGVACSPYLKPDWSPDSFRNAFYIGSIFAARAALVKKALVLPRKELVFADHTPIMRDMDMQEEQDILFLKMACLCGGFEKRNQMEFPIGHLDEVLYHRDPAQDLFCGRGFQEEIHPLERDVTVSIVIPSKDHPEVLAQCLRSMTSFKTGSPHLLYDVVIVDNGSTQENQEKTKALIQEIRACSGAPTDIVYICEPMEFNFSKMCNLGASRSAGEMILFLNDDIEIVQDNWLRELTAQAILPHAGAVGCKLLYPDKDTIQHAGITGIHIGPMHKMQQLSDAREYYFGANRGVHDLAGVTAACLMVSRRKFEEVGGYFEGLAVAFNDVDLNYKLLEAGYYNICCNHISLIHHESLSRGDDNLDEAKTERLMCENDRLLERHPEMYERDPFYHKLLEGEHVIPDFELMDPDETPADRLDVPKPKMHVESYPQEWNDECVWVRIDFNGTLARWNRLYYVGKRKEKAQTDNGYFIKGYSFVIGSDNAFYERRLMLRRVSDSKTLQPVDSGLYTLPVYDQPRDDIRKNLKDQVNVDLTGFRVRIGENTLPEGLYQIGMVYRDMTSRHRVMNWGSKCLTITAK